MSPRPAWRRLLSVLLVGAAVGFIVFEIAGNVEQLRRFDWSVQPALLGLSVLAMSGVFLSGILLWQQVLRGFGVDAPFRPLARAWFLSNLTRYVPGMIWQFVSMAQLGAGAGLAPAVAITSLLVQMVFFLLAAGVLSAFLLPAALAGPLEGFWNGIRFAAPAALLVVHPAVVRAALRGVGRLTRRPTLEWEGTWAGGIGLLALSLVVWLAYGGAFHLFLRSLTDLPLSALPAVTAMNALSFIVGYLAFFAPGGLGFKEGALAVLLSGLVPRPVAFALALAARLWTIAAELLPALFLVRRGSTEATPPAAP